MPGLVFSLILAMSLMAATGHSGDDARPPDNKQRKDSPAWVRWMDYKNSSAGKDYDKEWRKRQAAFLEGSDAINQILHIYGWKLRDIIFYDGKIGSTLYLFPKEWDKVFYVQDGKILFYQPDGSLTLIELESGKVIGRTRHYSPVYSIPGARELFRMGVEKWEQCGKILIGDGRKLVDFETGNYLETASETRIASPDRIVYTKYESPLNYSLYLLNGDTKQRIRLLDNRFTVTYTVTEDRILCISNNHSLPNTLSCFSLSDGAPIWEVVLPYWQNFHRLVCQDGVIYVFAAWYKNDTVTQIHTYDMQGRRWETLSATPDLFGGTMPDRFFGDDFSFKGVRHKGRRARSIPRIAETDNLWRFVDTLKDKYGVTAMPQAACMLPNGGFTWIECDPEDNIPRLRYRDDAHSWSGTIRAVDKLLTLEAGRGAITLFAIAGDEKHIVYASNSGRMECLDRVTGRSKWIYVFPMFYVDYIADAGWKQKERFTLEAKYTYGAFFTQRAAYCDNDLDAQGVLPFLVDGESAPKQTRIVLDPSPDMGHTLDVWPATITAWGVPLVLAAALAATWKTKKRLLFKSIIYVAVAICSEVVIFHFGGYSWYTYQLLRIAFWVAIILLVFPFIWPHIRARLDNPDYV